MHQSLLTGNIAPNAVVKVSAFGLQRWLDLEIGAYGSDDADRLRLVPVALERARLLRDLTFDPTRSGWWATPQTTLRAPRRPAPGACWWRPGGSASKSSATSDPTR